MSTIGRLLAGQVLSQHLRQGILDASGDAREAAIVQACEHGVNEYVSLIREHAECQGQSWVAEPRAHDDGQLADYLQLTVYYASTNPAALGPQLDDVRKEAADLMRHVIKVPSSFGLTICTSDLCGRCQQVTNVRRSEHPSWSAAAVLLPLQCNNYNQWYPGGQSGEGPLTFVDHEVELCGREEYADDGYPSFL